MILEKQNPLSEQWIDQQELMKTSTATAFTRMQKYRREHHVRKQAQAKGGKAMMPSHGDVWQHGNEHASTKMLMRQTPM